MEKFLQSKAEFCTQLRATGRARIEEVIVGLERIGFFESPASRKDHLCEPGGLVEHSLNVLRTARKIAEGMSHLRADVSIGDDSLVIASLLHDVCKAGRYHRGTTGDYKKDYSRLPAGHGEASVIWLLQQGLLLKESEVLAIRWHMGPWQVAVNPEMQEVYRHACTHCPLIAIIHTADTLAAQILEVSYEGMIM